MWNCVAAILKHICKMCIGCFSLGMCICAYVSTFIQYECINTYNNALSLSFIAVRLGGNGAACSGLLFCVAFHQCHGNCLAPTQLQLQCPVSIMRNSKLSISPLARFFQFFHFGFSFLVFAFYFNFVCSGNRAPICTPVARNLRAFIAAAVRFWISA